MKQIIPFKKELLFKTKISEITSISLEHTLSLRRGDLISGEFHISGDYKMTEASINREKFYFTLPFEIDLGASYYEGSMIIDIDNFYYEVVNDDSLQVNIDVYIDGEKIEKEEEKEKVDEALVDEEGEEDFFRTLDDVRDIVLDDEDDYDKENEVIIDSEDVDDRIKDINLDKKIDLEKEYESSVDFHNTSKKKIDLEKEVLSNNIASNISFDNDDIVNVSNVNKNNTDNINKNKLNIFDSDIFSEDTYATYYVYVVKEEDNIDKILEKFSTTKEELSNYNDLENVKMGTKLIIPSKNE